MPISMSAVNHCRTGVRQAYTFLLCVYMPQLHCFLRMVVTDSMHQDYKSLGQVHGMFWTESLLLRLSRAGATGSGLGYTAPVGR